MGYVTEDPQSRLLAGEKSLGMFIPPLGALRGKQWMLEACFVSWEVLDWKLREWSQVCTDLTPGRHRGAKSAVGNAHAR